MKKIIYILIFVVSVVFSCTDDDFDLAVIPTVETAGYIDKAVSNITILGKINCTGGAEIIEKGFVYSFYNDPTINDSRVIAEYYDEESLKFKKRIDGLSNAYNYYVRAYAKNREGIAYGEEIQFQLYEECEYSNLAYVQFVNTSDNPYDFYINGNFVIRLQGNSNSTPFTISVGNNTLYAEQVSGYLIYPTTRESTFYADQCVTYTWTIP